MRIYRRQKTLWAAGVVALFDIAIVCLASLFTSGGAANSGPSAAYVIQAASAQTSQGLPVTIIVEADSTIYLDGIPISLDNLGSQLGDALRIANGGHVSIETEAGVPIGAVSKALAIAGTSGAKSLSLVTPQPGGGG